MDYINVPFHQEISAAGLIYDLGSLYDYFTQVFDPRDDRGKQYSLAELLVLMVLAKMAGQQNGSQIADWVAHRLGVLMGMKLLPRGKAPSHMTYRRVNQNIVDVEKLEQLVRQYQQKSLLVGEDLVLSVDGKTVRGTIPSGETKGVHLLAVYVPDQGLVLAQVAVGAKENEIKQAPQLLAQVPLSGAIVLGDAMQTQRELSQQIVQAGGDFIWKVKGNQARTKWAIEKLFVQEVVQLQKGQPLSRDCQQAQTVNKGHGRIEKRVLLTSTQLNDYLDWPAVAQVFRLETIIQFQNGNHTRQVVYGLTSLASKEVSPARLLQLIRQYWGIESGLHYRRDVTLREDATRLSVGSAGQVMAILNNLVIHLALEHGKGNLAKALRRFDAKPDEALIRICAHPSTL
jgi:predicted transposase YbfD/YdcC